MLGTWFVTCMVCEVHVLLGAWTVRFIGPFQHKVLSRDDIILKENTQTRFTFIFT